MAKTTAKEIAAQLGLSAAAVSMAINGKPGVSDETRARVLAVCAQKGYRVRNSAHATTQHTSTRDCVATPAQTSKPSKTLCFMIFINELLHVWENSTVYTFNMQGVEAAAQLYGYNTIIRYLHADSILSSGNLNFLNSIDGLVLLGTDITPSCAGDLRTMLEHIPNTPTVILDSTMLFDCADCIGNDNFGGAYLAVTHLAQRGCTKIAYLCARSRIDIFKERGAGVQAALADTNLPLFAQVAVGISNDEAYTDTLTWLRSADPLPDAIFAENDVLAAAAARAMASCGIKIPGDISIIGFDNIPITEQTSPPLSTIHSYKDDLGAAAVQMIVQRALLNQHAPERQHGFLKAQMATRLIQRQSVR